jgi:hypothetical protein
MNTHKNESIIKTMNEFCIRTYLVGGDNLEFVKKSLALTIMPCRFDIFMFELFLQGYSIWMFVLLKVHSHLTFV